MQLGHTVPTVQLRGDIYAQSHFTELLGDINLFRVLISLTLMLHDKGKGCMR